MRSRFSEFLHSSFFIRHSPFRFSLILTFSLLLVMTAPPAIGASLRGVVVDRAGSPVEGARVEAGGAVAITEADGSFSLDAPEGVRFVTVRHERHLDASRRIESIESATIVLEPLPAISESVVVEAIRADDVTPVTTTNLTREEIRSDYRGQDVPALLTTTPSVTTYSDSGMGQNYSYFTLRGIGQTRINITLDGVPLNDQAEHALYFNNFSDFAGAVDSVQIQRGVGTSTVGAAAYGGSLNFTSMPLAAEQELSVFVTAGDFGTRRASVEYQSGISDGGFALYARAGVNETDGFREHSGVDQHSIYLNAAWFGEESMVKLVSFTGREETQLSYFAVEPWILEENLRFNPMYEEERDSFGQDFLALHYSRMLSPSASLVASAYYNGAQGWFDIFDDPWAPVNLLRYEIDQHTLGFLANVSHTVGPVALAYGVHVNDFEGDHFQTIAGVGQYFNTGFKSEQSAFVKAGWDVGNWHLYGDAQLRRAEFRYEGDVELGSVDWSFFNPKVGARYQLRPGMSVYGSVGRATREPTRLDMLSGEDNATVMHDLTAVKPEEVIDLELGLDWSTPGFALAANLYAMEFENEIALTGELSEVGLPLRRNAEDSYRRGIELDWRWQIARAFALSGNVNASRNRISEWTQHTDVYDEEFGWLDTVPVVYRNVRPVLSPELIANATLDWMARSDMVFSVSGRYVGESQLDNTGDRALVTPSFVTMDLRASVGLDRWIPLGRPTLNVFVNNLFDNDRIYASGYSWQYFIEDSSGGRTLEGIPYYYPNATRNVMVTLEWRM
jgi:iron complex outermembrane recepter protein